MNETDTPRTDKFQKLETVASDWMWREHSKQLEREINEAIKQREEMAEALRKLRDCDFVITPHDRMDAVREIARVALANFVAKVEKPTEGGDF